MALREKLQDIDILLEGEDEEVCIFAVGDFGSEDDDVVKVGNAMEKYCETFNQNKKPACILGLGDNFYSRGVTSVRDVRFKTVWYDQFLRNHPILHVPWYMVLGNHDYEGSYQSQIEFTNNVEAQKQLDIPNGVWQMPAFNYTFNFNVTTSKDEQFSIQMTGLDTNGCQFTSRRRKPSVKEELFETMEWLGTELAASSAKWKIAFGHHPMYTASHSHGLLARCLRSKVYKYGPIGFESEAPGFNMEEVAEKGGLDVYVTGHEHMMQFLHQRGVAHVVNGSSGAMYPGFYGGYNANVHMDWIDPSRSYFGFVAFRISSERCVIQFVNGKNGRVIEEFTLRK